MSIHVHHEHEKFQSKNVQIIWEAISKRMHAALPQVSERMMKELQKAEVKERVYSAGAINFLSRDLLVDNVGGRSHTKVHLTLTRMSLVGHTHLPVNVALVRGNVLLMIYAFMGALGHPL